jgi:hypothetical protein
VRLLYILAHWRAVRFFEALGYEPCYEELFQRRGSFSSSFSIARASALLALRQLPSAWAATFGLPRALVSNQSSPLTQQWISISLTKTICFLIPLPGGHRVFIE